MAGSSMIELRPATEAEKRTRDELTWPEWGDRLTLPQYLEREQALRAHRWSVEGMTTWLLTEGAEVLCSCETFRNHSSVGARAGYSFAVASVFTEPARRGRGFATRRISALLERLREQPDAQSSVLFSDVGAAIYQRSGYHPLPAWDWVLPPAEHALEAEWLAPLAAPVLATAADGELMLHPTPAQLDWHFERSRLYARFLGRPPLAHYGARTARATAWWTAQFKSDELLVLRLEAPDAAAAAPVLRAAQLEAKRAGLPRVRLWETVSLAGLEGAERHPRDGELPMVAGLNASAIEWRGVERACWV